jgi:hypothetical protein
MRLFKNEQNQQFFEENGYLVLDLLDNYEVERLKKYYDTLNNNHIGDYGFHVSMDNKSEDFINAVLYELENVIKPKTDLYFEATQMFTGSFVVKEPRPNSFVPPHQDWSFTDDNKYNSVTVWTCLSDTTIENGAMAVLPGSHKWFTGPRASPSPGFITPFQAHGMELFPYMTLIPMKAGQALIFENKTLHASPPNNSNEARVAAGIGLTQIEAPIYHYNVIPGSNPQTLQCYSIDRDFFLKYSNNKLLELQAKGASLEGYEKLHTTVNDPKIMSKEELIDLAIGAGNSKDDKLDAFLQMFKAYMAQMQSEAEYIQIGQTNYISSVFHLVKNKIRDIFSR